MGFEVGAGGGGEGEGEGEAGVGAGGDVVEGGEVGGVQEGFEGWEGHFCGCWLLAWTA